MRNNLYISNKFRTFTKWIGGSCNPSDKGKLTALPLLYICQQNVNKNVSTMLRFEDLPEINSERWLSLDDLDGEVWRSVCGYEGKLSVSNYGRVKRLENYITYKDGRTNRYKEIIYRPSVKPGGYLCLAINVIGKCEYFLAHRLVAQAFLPNPQNLPYVNHKDENPSNNCIYINNDGTVNEEKSNIEWCTPLYNNTYGTVAERKKQCWVRKGATKSVVLYDNKGNFVKKYDTYHDIERQLGVSRSATTLCCEGKSPTALGLNLRFSYEVYVDRNESNVAQLSVMVGGKLILLSSLDIKGVFVNLSSLRECIYKNGKPYKRNNIISVFSIAPNCDLIRIENKRKIMFRYLKI